MSKAFTREDDDAPEPQPITRVMPVLPPGVKNLITASGAEALRRELAQPGVTAAQPGVTAARAAEAQNILQSTVVRPPPPKPWDYVEFGATVTVRDGDEVDTYRLVGANETDLDKNWINWCSPLASALMNGRVGQRVRFRERELEILKIEYQ